ncbi:MAG TPA: alpha/beta hydrolase [Burkholderiaceae bacterium]|nr:alpha/beta hydrolase [Burkholderiaceae bacterium]
MTKATTLMANALDRETHIYKVVEGQQIKADVFGASVGANRPAVVWIHGGGLIFGSRTTPRPAFLAALLRGGVVVISIDHRLAPETKLADIVDDVRDAWRWVVEQGPSLLGIDPERVAMAGGSSGAYLTLMSGYCVQPKPRALAAFAGFGDITTPWEAEPSAHYLEKFPPISREEAVQKLGTALAEPGPEVDRGYFYVYCRQQGRWPIEVTGHDPLLEPRWFDAYCPIRNVTAQYPPTMLIHGRLDTDVPCEESQKMAVRLGEANVEYELLTLDGIGHGLSGASPEVVTSVEGRAAAFLVEHLR